MMFKQAWQWFTEKIDAIRWVLVLKWALCILLGTVLPIVGLLFLYHGLEMLHEGVGLVVVGFILLAYSYFVARVIPLPWK